VGVVNLAVLLTAGWTAYAGLPAVPAPLVVASPAPVAAAAPVPQFAPAVVPPDRRFALVVGVAAYRGRIHDTIGGKNDASTVWSVLVASGWQPKNIKVLTDDQATVANVRAAMAWLVERSAPDTFTMFHYSGHVQRRNGHQLLWPVDNVYIPDTEVVATLGRLQGSSWLSFAGCHAAGFDDGLASPTRLVTASSQVTEKSFEEPDWGLSVWAGTLFDQALSRRLADADHDARVTLSEALTYAVREAAHVTRFQGEFGYGPQHGYVAGGLGAGWSLDAPPTVRGATLPVAQFSEASVGKRA
jgi:hypothetical protein